MEVHHKPKSVHGWREFLTEVVIIVIGVLIALGAEAVVAHFHDARISEEGRRSVIDELNLDVTNAARRSMYEPCIRRRLDDVAALLDSVDAGARFVPPANIARPPSLAVYTQRWQAATAGGRTSLLSPNQQQEFARVYNTLSLFTQVQTEEQSVWMELDVLPDIKELPRERVYDLRRALTKARILDERAMNFVKQARFYAEKVGVKSNAKLLDATGSYFLKSASTAPICQPFRGL